MTTSEVVDDVENADKQVDWKPSEGHGDVEEQGGAYQTRDAAGGFDCRSLRKAEPISW